MGCATSKRVEATAKVYRPAPASFTVFDINSIQEPWLLVDPTPQYPEKPAHLPTQILDKLNTIEAEQAPHSWDEVSKTLEDLKPIIHSKTGPIDTPPAQAQAQDQAQNDNNNINQSQLQKRPSIHTLEELDAKLKPKPNELLIRKSESMKSRTETRVEIEVPKGTEILGNVKPVKENIFVLKDRLEREKEGKEAMFDKIKSLNRDPLSEYPEKCPPGGGDSVVLYTTSLRGVRRTYEDCSRVRTILEGHRVVFDERDVSLHGGFLSELKELTGEDGVNVPKVFVKGRYVGGVDEVVELNESGRLGRILNYARVERGVGRQACGGCGGARFVPCLECGGSCKVVIGNEKERCPKCNENGLVHCMLCV